jgi:hypothetical protein
MECNYIAIKRINYDPRHPVMCCVLNVVFRLHKYLFSVSVLQGHVLAAVRQVIIKALFLYKTQYLTNPWLLIIIIIIIIIIICGQLRLTFYTNIGLTELYF